MEKSSRRPTERIVELQGVLGAPVLIDLSVARPFAYVGLREATEIHLVTAHATLMITVNGEPNAVLARVREAQGRE